VLYEAYSQNHCRPFHRSREGSIAAGGLSLNRALPNIQHNINGPFSGPPNHQFINNLTWFPNFKKSARLSQPPCMFLIDIPFKGCQGRSNRSLIMHAVSYFACDVNDTACTMHGVPMTPHAPCMWCQWQCMHHACSIKDTACTKKMFAQLRKVKIICKTKTMTPHAFKKIWICSQIRTYIQKGFCSLIRGQGRMFWWKNRGLKISWHCPFNRLSMLCSTMLIITQCYFNHLFLSSDIMVLLYYVDWYNDMCINCLVDIMWVDISTPWS
jgi:hypothetical protein